ncbi:rod shape-determining protein MreD [Dasania sp. GY-MA-18]|uniref:Rod shape-determining protein MreD n=1 Tax=Dasania phycosphaerae TaxID=2950436 RepID=A0A9J6RJ67_9GAMM|nr:MULTISPECIES: rod shape-determining protein MreD [Dasania]MCR8921585.1 rod shape-determining protein MreD [Dasania sp. GY-MA-18]MCZ0864013.1 rod shape-determining protein MreD [Dasania phycosphaerae]MCZ0867741.1 rod shape-determining protein MreD [Dasania phycosphaerae]
MQQPANGIWVIVVSIVLALLLSIMPMPFWAQWGRPEWLAMVLIYWVIALPERVGIGIAWLSGLVLDIIEGTPLGQNAFALAVIAYVALVLYQRMRMYTPWQQAGVLFILIGVHQLIGHWVQTLIGVISPNLLFLLPALVSALLWPWLSALLRFCRRYFYVS